MKLLAFYGVLTAFLLLRTYVLCAQDFENIQSNVLHDKQPNHADIVLIGAVGDLAKKYLWKGLFDLFRNYSSLSGNGWTFSFTGVGRKNHSVNWPQLDAIIHEVVHCDKNVVRCMKDKQNFIASVSYVQLKTHDDYKIFCTEHLQETGSEQNFCYKGQQCQYQRIFYLSVPPFTYESITEFISTHCSLESKEQLKVVLEKPFGHDQPSSVSMAEAISQNLNDNAVYRIDHYLGKQAVGQIINFRLANKQVEKLMNRNFVERIEIVMKETIGVKGRTSFYDQYGVMCDVMQNHLTEILILLTMDLPSEESDSITEFIMKGRLDLLKQIMPIQQVDVLLGQYEDYVDEVRAEAGSSETSTTPTFAVVRLRINSERWNGVPIIIMAGKQMDERVGYARVVFKESEISANSEKDCPRSKQLSFHIGHGTLKTPAIVASKSLFTEPYSFPDQWKHTGKLNGGKYLHTEEACFETFVPEVVKDAYSMLIEQLFLGRKEYFVTTESLLESWRIWANIGRIQKNHKLVIYPGGKKNGKLLDIIFHDGGLLFASALQMTVQVKEMNVLGHNAYVGTQNEVMTLLGQAIRTASSKSMTNEKEFHIAFSGGSSPLPLFQYLAHVELHNIYWQSVHVWQVDERCSSEDSLSNFNSICNSFINQIPQLKHQNIHPMLYPNEQCWEGSAERYEHTMVDVIGKDPVFDFVVLGVGTDGHTASLFPYNPTLNETNRYVTLTETRSATAPKRMTLTNKSLMSAKHIAVIVSGPIKRDIMETLILTNCIDKEKYPICKVLETTSNLSWYITKETLST